MKTGFKDPYSKGYSIPSSLRESNTYRLKYGTIFNHFKKVVKDKERLLNHNLLFEKKQFFYGYLRNCKKQLNWNGGRQVENLISLAYFLRVNSTTSLKDPKT